MAKTEKLLHNQKKSNFIDSLLILYFCLKPIYVFSSGGLQPADIIILLLFLFLIYIKKFKIVSKVYLNNCYALRTVMILFVVFVSWIFMSNSLSFFKLNEVVILKSTLFYIFNFLVLIVIYQYFLIYGERLFIVIYNAVILTLFLQLSLLLLIDSGGRGVILFNNPNQLAYFSLIMLTILLILHEKEKFKGVTLSGVLISVFLILYSNSTSAIAASSITIILYLMFNKNIVNLFNWALIIIVFNSSIVFIVESKLIEDFDLLNNVMNRIENKQENSNGFIEGRGYGRVFEVNSNVFWGMGEGAFDRFTYLKGAELHSTVVGTFVNYGLIGMIIFMLILWKSLIHNKSMHLDKA